MRKEDTQIVKISKRGFTLVELLVVIAILGVLAAVTIIVINPAQMLAQARDAQRINDLRSVHSALSLFLATAIDTTFSAAGPFSSAAGATACAFTTVTPPTEVCTVREIFTVGGLGWVSVDLGRTAGGSTLATLPRDPVNNAAFFYAFKADLAARTYELNTRLESERYRPMMINDGGNRNTDCPATPHINCFYEIGSAPGLIL